MKEQDKATARDLNETDISNMPDGEFEAMIIRILTGLEKRNEDMSEKGDSTRAWGDGAWYSKIGNEYWCSLGSHRWPCAYAEG